MRYSVEDIEDDQRFKLLLKIPYNELVVFVLDYLRKRTLFILIFWAICLLFLGMAIYFRLNLSAYQYSKILFHSMLGFILFPLLSVPVHELLHVMPYYLTGARNIRAGMDLRQYLFYVTAHRYVAGPSQFRLIAMFPFVLISITLLVLLFFVPDLWKWSLSAFLFLHATMCAGDFALLNFYALNRKKEIYTWDDADKKEAYFFEKLKIN
jgi:hypothetical protein